jgi:hypothetical protein
MHSKFRVYFYRDNQELRSHPLNGAEWTWSGGFVPNTTGSARKARCEMEVQTGKTYHRVTVASFGNAPVAVKWWAPGEVQWFDLVPPPAGHHFADMLPSAIPSQYLTLPPGAAVTPCVNCGGTTHPEHPDLCCTCFGIAFPPSEHAEVHDNIMRQAPGEPASREEQYGRYLDCGPGAWDDR